MKQQNADSVNPWRNIYFTLCCAPAGGVRSSPKSLLQRHPAIGKPGTNLETSRASDLRLHY